MQLFRKLVCERSKPFEIEEKNVTSAKDGSTLWGKRERLRRCRDAAGKEIDSVFASRD